MQPANKVQATVCATLIALRAAERAAVSVYNCVAITPGDSFPDGLGPVNIQFGSANARQALRA
jgi:hypothetical protein